MFERYVERWARLLAYNDSEADPWKFSIYLFSVPLIAGSIAAFLLGLQGIYLLAPPLAFSAAAHIAVYSYLAVGANARAEKVEKFLPDFLSLVASNIRSGLTPDKALIISARPEFGQLTKAVNDAGKGSVTGMPLDQVMLGISERIDSATLAKTMRLLVEGLHSGGDITELLEKTSLDLRRFQFVRKETSSIVLNYVLFITAAMAFGAPLLYGIASFLVEIMLKIKSKVAANADFSAMGQISIFKGKLAFTSDSVALFAVCAIAATAFFGCTAIGVMSTGRKMDGLKHFPLILLIALAIFFGIRFLLGSVLNPLIGS